MTNAKEMMNDKNLVIFYIIKGTNESGEILWKPRRKCKPKDPSSDKWQTFPSYKNNGLIRKHEEKRRRRKMRQLQGKCKEYLEKGLCLGCERLAMPDFIGDDNCIYIKEREDYENWNIRR